MLIYKGSSKAAAQFVGDILTVLDPDLLSITITVLAKSGGCSVYIATDTSSEDIVKTRARNFLEPLTNILRENTQDG